MTHLTHFNTACSMHETIRLDTVDMTSFTALPKVLGFIITATVGNVHKCVI